MKDEFRRGPHRPEVEPFSAQVEGTVSHYLLNPRGKMLGRATDALARVEPPPAKPKKHPEGPQVREEES